MIKNRDLNSKKRVVKLSSDENSFFVEKTSTALFTKISRVAQKPFALEYYKENGEITTLKIGSKLSVGRHTDNDLQILDAEISKFHFVIERQRHHYFFKDLDSANGSEINGKVVQAIRLEAGDIICVGQATLKVIVVDDYDEKTRTLGFLEANESSQKDGTQITLVPQEFFGDSMQVAEDFGEHSWLEDEDEIPLSKDLDQEYLRLKTAFDLILKMGNEYRLDVLGHNFLSEILKTLTANSAVIMLKGDDNELVPLADISEKSEVSIPKAFIERVITEKRGLLTTNAMNDSILKHSHTVVRQQIRSALCVPLLNRDEVLGVIYLYSSSAAVVYTESDLDFLRMLAGPAALSIKNAYLLHTVEEDALLKQELSRFLSPVLVEKALNRQLIFSPQGEMLRCSVLFLDIRGFTALSETLSPHNVVTLLNEFFDVMVNVIFEFEGTLDKFMGDGLMAVWGLFSDKKEQTLQAILAAQAMRLALFELNKKRSLRGEQKLEVGFGIATGDVIVGAMGARRRQDFTVIGSTVNLASRLCNEAQSKEVMICEASYQECANRLGDKKEVVKSVRGFRNKQRMFIL